MWIIPIMIDIISIETIKNLLKRGDCKMKKMIVGILLVGGMVLGNVKAFAFVPVPGVDMPIDPPDYYSPTSVSVPDSTTTPFTMKDLSRNGYQTYDVRNNAKSIIAEIKGVTEMVNTITNLAYQIKNLASMSPEGILAHYLGISQDLADIAGVWQAYNGLMAATDTAKNAWTSAFRSVEDFSQGKTSVTKQMGKNKDLLNVLETTYKDSMATAKALGDQQNDIKMLENALNKLESASGNLENQQIRTQIESLEVSLAIKRNLLLGNLVSLKSITGKAKIDQEVKDKEATREGAAFMVSDPYHPTSYDKKNFDRPKGKGMIDF